MRHRLLISGLAAAAIVTAKAEPPVAVYAFPAGGQRGTEVSVRIGGLFFHGQADFGIEGGGVKADSVIKEMPRLWFEGPMLVQPQSQRGEDYPRDHAAKIAIEKNAAPGPRRWRCSTAQGITASFPFIVGDLPEIVEAEQDGQAVPVAVNVPLTINGRLFPRQDRDIWEFEAAAGEWITGEIMAKRLGYPLDPDITVTTATGQTVKTETASIGGDPRFAFRAPQAGRYLIEIGDGNYGGGQNGVYRLTLRRGETPTAVFPLGGKRGSQASLEFTGSTLARPATATQPLPATGDWHTVSGANGTSFLLQLGDDSEAVENNNKGTLPLPGVANGRVLAPGQTDDWTLALKKGEAVSLEIFAARLGSRLDSKLTLLDDTGKELAANDDATPVLPDSLLSFTAPADGSYHVRVSDRFTSRGGPDFGYRLHTRAGATADFRLTLVDDALTVVRDPEPVAGQPVPEPVDAKGKPIKKPRPRGSGIVVNLDPIGPFKSDVLLEIEGLPEGVTIEENSRKLAFARKTTEVFFDATPATLIQNKEIKIRGTAEVDGQKITREAVLPFRLGEPVRSEVRFAIAPPVPFSFAGEYWVETGYPIGSRLTKTYRLERGTYTGPLQVEMSDRQIRHLQGVTAQPATIPPGPDSFTYTIALAPRMEMGRTSRVQLMLSGEIADRDGRKYRVSYTNAQPEQQMMSILSEGRLSLTTASQSVRAKPNAIVRLAVIVKRDPSLAALPVRLALEVPATAGDLVAASVELPPGEEKAEVEIRFGPRPGPFLEPVKLRATTVSQDSKQQHESEIELEMVPAEPLTAAARPIQQG